MLDALQDVGMLLDQGLAPAYSQWRQGSIEVFPHRTAEFRLAAVGLDDAHVRADADKGAIKQVGTDPGGQGLLAKAGLRSEEHTSELQSLMRISYAVFCLNKKKK